MFDTTHTAAPVPYRSGGQRRRYRATRWIVPSMIASLIAIAWFDIRDPALVRELGIVLLILPIIVASLISPFPTQPWLGRRALKDYDEFERVAIAQAAARAYTVLLGLAVVGICYVGLAPRNGWWAPSDESQWVAIGRATLGTGWLLAILFAEWLVPLPALDDPSED